MSEQPGRYQRSASGMVGAMIVLLLGIGAFVGFRALNRDELEVSPEAVDYLTAVEAAQAESWDVAYPQSLPEGWRATSLDAVPGRAWGIGFLTPGGFAGLQQSADSLPELLRTYVDDETEQRESVDLDSALASRWDSYADEGGDLAYAAEVDGQQVLVYGSAPAADLRALAEALTTEPVG